MPCTPRVSTELPGPRARAAMVRGQFDMQSIYRAAIVDDGASLGTTLVDVDGNAFLDLFASFALGALGYNHPSMVQTAASPEFVRAAINPTSTPFVTTEGWLDFIHEMETRWAPRGMGKMFCVDGGGEGVESALKAAFIAHGENRRVGAGGPRNPLELSAEAQAAWMDNAGTDALLISFSGAFHGRGLGPMSATHSKLIHKADLPAFPWPTAPFPANRWPREKYAEDNARAEAESLAAVERLLDANAGKVAAVLVEPIQSEGGDRHASPAFFQALQKMVSAAGASLVLDEVQTGVGITGTLWFHEQLNLPTPPDFVCFGKKMQMGGFFATLAKDVRQFGRMYQTRNGDRARAMLALTTLRAIADGNLLNHVRETGGAFLQGLQALEARFPTLVSEPRGKGFLLAFDLPTAASRDDFLARCMRRGVFASYTGTRSVRLRPHLITPMEDVNLALATFGDVLLEMSG